MHLFTARKPCSELKSMRDMGDALLGRDGTGAMAAALVLPRRMGSCGWRPTSSTSGSTE